MSDKPQAPENPQKPEPTTDGERFISGPDDLIILKKTSTPNPEEKTAEKPKPK
jgi:hypothetical protein